LQRKKKVLPELVFEKRFYLLWGQKVSAEGPRQEKPEQHTGVVGGKKIDRHASDGMISFR